LKAKGLVYSHKQANTNEHKYHLTTDKPVLGTTDLTKPKRKLKAVKRKSTYNKDGVNTTNSFNTPPTPKPEHNVPQLLQRLSSLELTLIEKEKEVWTLECEVFDKKAVIKYLEEKLFQLGLK
jgi:hypothetical protein